MTYIKFLHLPLAVLTFLSSLTSCAPAANDARSAGLMKAAIASAKLPECAQYPNEFSDSFEKQYKPWSDQRRERFDVAREMSSPTGFYKTSTAGFLSGAGNENRVYSPINVYMALSVLAETTGGSTRSQILELLGSDDIVALRKQAGDMWKTNYRDDGGTATILANSLWLNKDVDYNKKALGDIAKNYYASSYCGDFSDSATTELLRGWLNEQTRGLLEDSVNGLELSPETVLSICSTVYFNAKWDSEFSESDNDTRVFHSPRGDVEKTFMNTTNSYGNYFAGDDFGASRLAFEDGGAMWLILPDEDKSVDDVLASGQYLDMVKAENRYENQKQLVINYSVPKFDVSSDIDLSDGLKALGVTDVFSADKADFSPVLSGPAWLDTAEHAARVVIDEKGCKAAAFTAMMTCGAALPPDEEMDFVLDRPFIFVITSDVGEPLFVGVVNNP